MLVDHRQNGTIASLYSVRPKPGAPVSTPLRCEELTPDMRPRDFTMTSALDRVARNGDLFSASAAAAALAAAARRLGRFGAD